MIPRARFFPAVLYSPNAEAFHVVAEISNEPGALADALTGVRGQLNVMSSMTYTVTEKKAVASILGYALSSKVTEDTLRSSISRSPSVLDVRVVGSKDGFVVDTFHRGTSLAPGQPVVLLPAEGMTEMFRKMSETFGSGASVLMFEQGMALGKQSGGYWLKLLGEKYVRSNVGKLVALYNVLGWGKVRAEVVEDGKRYVAEVEDCFECAGGKGQGCFFFKGHMIGVLATFFRARVAATETSCRFKGDKSCRFQISVEETGRGPAGERAELSPPTERGAPHLRMPERRASAQLSGIE